MVRFLRLIAEYIAIGVVLLGFIIVYRTLRANAFNGYILARGILLMVVPAAIYFIHYRRTERRGFAPQEPGAPQSYRYRFRWT